MQRTRPISTQTVVSGGNDRAPSACVPARLRSAHPQHPYPPACRHRAASGAGAANHPPTECSNWVSSQASSYLRVRTSGGGEVLTLPGCEFLESSSGQLCTSRNKIINRPLVGVCKGRSFRKRQPTRSRPELLAFSERAAESPANPSGWRDAGHSAASAPGVATTSPLVCGGAWCNASSNHQQAGRGQAAQPRGPGWLRPRQPCVTSQRGAGSRSPSARRPVSARDRRGPRGTCSCGKESAALGR
ncbi:unnamed protein product, partial [Gulo gulo]